MEVGLERLMALSVVSWGSSLLPLFLDEDCCCASIILFTRSCFLPFFMRDKSSQMTFSSATFFFFNSSFRYVVMLDRDFGYYCISISIACN